MTRSILIIDDDAANLELMAGAFASWGWRVHTAHAGEAGLALYDRERPDLVLLDLDLAGNRGLGVLVELRRRDPEATVIMLTTEGDIARVVQAMKLGAEDVLTRPVDLDDLQTGAERAYEKVDLRCRGRDSMDQRRASPDLDALGRSAAMREIARLVRVIAPSDHTVLLTGETGTGKSWVAQLIHALSPRVRAPFVEINCASLSVHFLESELFGHERGAFTDAKVQKRGLLEIADRGTLLLDEVGELALELQPKLLKVLKSRRFRRLGATREIELDVRIIAATNRELEAEVRAGRFREDLYYRLNVLPVRLPPLCERGRRDIERLCFDLLQDARRRARLGPARLSPDALELLVRYDWPGNIRELKNVLERVVLLAGDAEELRAEHLPPEIRGRALAGRPPAAEDGGLTLAEVEQQHILRVLRQFDGNRSRAAQVLGISRAGLYKKLRRYGITDSASRAPTA
jgi:DNA-binding NtrC family response regulator